MFNLYPIEDRDFDTSIRGESMRITLNEYIKNPTGGRAHAVGQKEAVAAIYEKKFNMIMLKSTGVMRRFIYKAKDDSRFMIYLKLPSETIDELTYDVVIDFYTTDDPVKKEMTLENYWVRFFSNDPNFVFTYSYVFKINGLLVPELQDKFKYLDTKPKVTNPNKIVGYVKSLYMAYLYIMNQGMMQKSAWYNAPSVKTSELSKMIMSCDKKIVQANKLKSLQAAVKNGSMHIKNPDDLDELEFKSQKLKSFRNTKKVSQAVYQGNVKRAKQVHRVSKVKYI